MHARDTVVRRGPVVGVAAPRRIREAASCFSYRCASSARSDEAAWDRANTIAKAQEHSFANVYGNTVEWVLREVIDVIELLDDAMKKGRRGLLLVPHRARDTTARHSSTPSQPKATEDSPAAPSLSKDDSINRRCRNRTLSPNTEKRPGADRVKAAS
jgi:Domain of unknown function (DUF4288)